MAERAAARRGRLDVPTDQRRRPRTHYDPDAFGRVSERIARFLGTARFLVYMTVFIAVWIGINVTPIAFDPYTFTFLTLLLSLQASYAAPLILLAQNRQTDRDRVSLEEDRAQNARLMAEVEYLSRELASLRSAVGEMATRDFLRDQLREVTEEVVARSGESAGQAFYDRAAREKREERERRAERRRSLQQREEQSGVVSAGLAEPFAGEPAEV